MLWTVELLCFAPTDGGEPERLMGESEDLFDGTYELSYTPTKAGNYQAAPRRRPSSQQLAESRGRRRRGGVASHARAWAWVEGSCCSCV